MSFVPLSRHNVQMDLIDMPTHSKCWFKESIGEKPVLGKTGKLPGESSVCLHFCCSSFLFLFNKHLLLSVSQ